MALCPRGWPAVRENGITGKKHSRAYSDLTGWREILFHGVQDQDPIAIHTSAGRSKFESFSFEIVTYFFRTACSWVEPPAAEHITYQNIRADCKRLAHRRIHHQIGSMAIACGLNVSIAFAGIADED